MTIGNERVVVIEETAIQDFRALEQSILDAMRKLEEEEAAKTKQRKADDAIRNWFLSCGGG